MLCEECGKNSANIHIKQVINGVTSEKNLCINCAKKYGYTNTFNFGDFFAGMVTNKPEYMICENCHTTFDSFEKTGILGCSQCYTYLRDGIKPLLKRIHGKVQHTASNGESFIKMNKREMEIQKLQKELNNAVKLENYERAAEIRDQIKEMQRGDNSDKVD